MPLDRPSSRISDDLAWRLIGLVLIAVGVPLLCEYILRMWIGLDLRSSASQFRGGIVLMYVDPQTWDLEHDPIARQVGVMVMSSVALIAGVSILLRPETAARRFRVTSRRMPDVRWFILAVRLLGMTMIGLSLPRAAGLVEQLFVGGWVDLFSEPWWRLLVFYPLMLTAVFGQPLFGLYLIFRGGWLIQRCLRGIATRCPECGYELRGLQVDRCPECALPIVNRPAVQTSGTVS